MALGLTQSLNRNEYQEYFLGGKRGPCVGLKTFPHTSDKCLEIWEHQRPGTLQDLSRHVMGLLSLQFTFRNALKNTDRPSLIYKFITKRWWQLHASTTLLSSEKTPLYPKHRRLYWFDNGSVRGVGEQKVLYRVSKTVRPSHARIHTVFNWINEDHEVWNRIMAKIPRI